MSISRYMRDERQLYSLVTDLIRLKSKEGLVEAKLPPSGNLVPLKNSELLLILLHLVYF